MPELKKVDETLQNIDHNFNIMINAFEKQNTVNDEFLVLFKQMKVILTDFEMRLKLIEKQLSDCDVVHLHQQSKEIH